MAYDERSYLITPLPLSHFPSLLHEIPDPPKTLSFRGNLETEGKKILAVVGSRNYSSYGKEVTSQLIRGLRNTPVAIVSGLALGIDGFAHTAALDCGVYTIAVPGSGLNDEVLYPSSHKNLAHRILNEGGALLSEFDNTQTGTPWTFPQRNRIMAGMSHAVLIIEASEKSGTLITARLAMEYNRDVLAVPGSIMSRNSYGPHMLIREGATPITSSDDIKEALGLTIQSEQETNTLQCSDEEKRVLDALTEPLTKDALIRKLGMNTSEANSLITLMEIKELIKEVDGILFPYSIS